MQMADVQESTDCPKYQPPLAGPGTVLESLDVTQLALFLSYFVYSVAAHVATSRGG